MITILLLQIIINLLIISKFELICRLIKLYDLPNNKLKIHKKKMPLVGGIIVLINLIFLSIITIGVDKNLYNFSSFNEHVIFIVFLIIFFFIGFYDDKYNLNPNLKFILSIIFIYTYVNLNENLLINDIYFSLLEKNINIQNFSILFTVFSFLILLNAINFFDGINGQSLIFFIAIFFILLLKTQNELYVYFLIFLSFILFLNLKNKTFLGDNGIFLLSFILSTFIIYEYNVLKTIVYADEIFLMLVFPGLDLLRLTFFRVINKKNPFYGDRNHVHHLLIKKFSLFKSNLILLSMTLLPYFTFFIFENFLFSFGTLLFLYLVLILFLQNKIKINKSY